MGVTRITRTGMVPLDSCYVYVPISEQQPDCPDEPDPGPDPGPVITDEALSRWARLPEALVLGPVVRDINHAVLAASVVWPDGVSGQLVTDATSTAFPGAVDGYHITYGSPTTKTFTQPVVTRNVNGAITTLPDIVRT
jgi:hypothetical protein